MKIARFVNFLNESHTKDEETFKDIFIDLVHIGFTIEFEKGFFSDLKGGYSEHATQSFRKPGYVIKLRKSFPEDKISVDFESAKSVMEVLEECSSRISEYGEHTLEEIDFNPTYFRIEYRLLDKESEEEDVNTSDGFDDFISKIDRKWSEAHNKLTRAFKFERTKEGIILSPIDSSITDKQIKSLFTIAKTFIGDSVRRKYYMGGGPNWLFKYDIKLEDRKIHIIFKERIDETPVHARANRVNWFED